MCATRPKILCLEWDIDLLERAFESRIHAPHLPATPYELGIPLPPSFPPGSSFCAWSRLRVISLKISKWRTIKSCPSKGLFALSLSAALSNEM